MAYDNITSLPGWLSNGLCGLSTGTGFSIRSLGTDDEETIFVAQRPIIIDGINDFVDKGRLGRPLVLPALAADFTVNAPD